MSLERALALHGLIPEVVPVVQSVTRARPMVFETPAGTFQYRHVKQSWFFGYRETELASGSALIAVPEKALLDVVYLSRGAFTPDRIAELRLQELDRLNLAALTRMASGHGERAAGDVDRALETPPRAKYIPHQYPTHCRSRHSQADRSGTWTSGDLVSPSGNPCLIDSINSARIW
ncbi:MAG TPA: hypothetical protein VNO30_17585 [Kofleriaceae bacterium]|nr:hypothetical protein [Kofleriaceae bacterium]